MSKGYWIVQSDISDMDQHSEYVKANRAVLARHGARFLVRWGQQEIVEGAARDRQVVIEFPDYAAAVACYHEPRVRGRAPAARRGSDRRRRHRRRL